MEGNAMVSLGDAMLLGQRNGGYGGCDGMAAWMNNPFFYLIFLAFFGNGGNGGFGFGGGNGALTRAELTQGFNDQDTRAGIRGIQQGLCDGFYAVNTGMLNGFNGVTSAISGCCCETNRNIDAVRYESSRNTCDIVNAIHGEGAATRELIREQATEALREKLNETQRQLQSANGQLSQLSQTRTIIDTLRPIPVPAYTVQSPYVSYGYNCGCGCAA